jgi:hypothetical protein
VRKLLGKSGEKFDHYATPSESVLQAIAECLGDGEWLVRLNASYVLRWKESLPPAVLRVIVARFTDPSKNVRVSARHALQQKPRLPKDTLQTVMEQLDGSNALDARKDALHILSDQKSLSPAAVQVILALFENEKEQDEIRLEALLALRSQTYLPAEVLRRIAAFRETIELLPGSNRLPPSRELIVHLLCNQSTPLPDGILEPFCDNTRFTHDDILASLRKQRALPVNFLRSLVGSLENTRWRDCEWRPDVHPDFQADIVKVLSIQDSLPPCVLEDVAALLPPGGRWRDSENSYRILDILLKQPTVPEKALQFVVPLLGSKVYRYKADVVLRKNMAFYATMVGNGKHLQDLYDVWLRRSFNEQLGLYASQDGGLCLYMPEGIVRLGNTKVILAARAELLGDDLPVGR